MKARIFVFFTGLICSLSSCHNEEPDDTLDYQSYLSSYDYSSFINKDIVCEEIIDTITFNKTVLIKDNEIYDKINNITWKYNIIIPTDYNEENIYPVIYLLHGRTATCDSWWKSLKIQEVVEYYYSKNMMDLLVIMPDANDTYYVNEYLDDIKYETFFIEEFLSFIEKKYSIISDSKARYIGGYSMGGYGASYYALKYGDLFSFCYAMSTPLDGKGNSLTPSIFNFLNKSNKESYPYLIFDIGNNDQFLDVNVKSHIGLELIGVPHEFILREGGHDAKFWRESLFILFDRLSIFMQEISC